MENQYSILAEYYDQLQYNIDFFAMADYIETCFSRFLPQKPQLLLDLACGTGNITIPLASRGYDMIGVDISNAMLSRAIEKSLSAGLSSILYLEQDMRSFELYGTVDAVVCCLDSINYLLKTAEVERCFQLVYNYLNPNGLFLFDVNTPYKFENVFADHSYVMESDEVYLGWQNDYSARRKICRFDLDIFVRNNEGDYERYMETQYEKAYSIQTLKRLLERNDFEILGIFEDMTFKDLTSTGERAYFVCRSQKGKEL